MNPRKTPTLLPHEIVFGIFLLATWGRLVWAVGFLGRDALVYLGFLAVNALLIARCVARPTNLAWRLRLVFYALAMNLLFAHMKVAIPEIHPASMDGLLERWQSLEPELGTRKLWYHQGVPLFPMGPLGLYALALAALAPLVLAGALLNLPPLVAGCWAGKRFPDGRNVISLWRILVGVPVFIVWALTVVAVALALGRWCSLAGYLLLTWLALKNYYRVKKLAVAVHNGCRHADVRPTLLAFREMVLQEIPDEPA